MGFGAGAGTGTGKSSSAEKATTLEELRQRYRTVVRTELDLLAPEPTAHRVSKRRSSLLRATGRRVSDANAYFEWVSEVASSCASEELGYDDDDDDEEEHGSIIMENDDVRRRR